MAIPKLKVRPLLDRTPTKVSVSLEPTLLNDLSDYASVYQQTYGNKISVAALIPSMLTALLESDAAFKRKRRELTEAQPTHQN